MAEDNYLRWGAIFDERMNIRRQVMDALGIDLPKSIDEETREAIRRSIINCLGCKHTRSCIGWLTLADATGGPPDFCPNKEVLEMLKSKSG
ncbi:hypothetical protein GQ651_08280 [Alphaproteobacteria bacterium GH1-50]|uniref:DUF6455 domain-containing protein n=1 Tax=Kangsaoukella pontilimi TaxID=2691042 RepID=A0A7C9IHQ2_9RHOB|nr:DUF6455 family protein [Kangsaoukella pontilimi]MXQ07842.1 hypothetical protein [Kangsaoukella pontilimi]